MSKIAFFGHYTPTHDKVSANFIAFKKFWLQIALFFSKNKSKVFTCFFHMKQMHIPAIPRS